MAVVSRSLQLPVAPSNSVTKLHIDRDLEVGIPNTDMFILYFDVIRWRRWWWSNIEARLQQFQHLCVAPSTETQSMIFS